MKCKKVTLIKTAGIVLTLTVIAVILFSAYIGFFVPQLNGAFDEENEENEDREYRVIIVGCENEAFLKNIYKGAAEKGIDYDCAVELNIPSSNADSTSLQSLLDYASFTNADGVVAYIGETNHSIQVPLDRNKNRIPLITLSQYLPEIPQVSHIGTNYSELGRKIAMESAEYLSGDGSIIVINTTTSNTPNYSTLMSGLTQYLSGYEEIHTTVIDLPSSTDITIRNGRMDNIVRYNDIDVIICLSTDDTIRTAQLVNDAGKTGYIGIIGFGEGNVVEKYLEYGIITELLSIDAESMGKAAISELFEYIKFGYANNYITADVKVRKAEENTDGGQL